MKYGRPGKSVFRDSIMRRLSGKTDIETGKFDETDAGKLFRPSFLLVLIRHIDSLRSERGLGSGSLVLWRTIAVQPALETEDTVGKHS
jgi:hypothetical protein